MNKLTRRSALQKMAGASALVATSGAWPVITAADLKGNINHSVCKWCYRDMTVEELADACQKMGIQSIEIVGPEAWPVLAEHDLTCAMASFPDIGITRGLNRVEEHDRMVGIFEEYLPQAAEAGLPNAIVFSGNRDGMDDEEGLENCVVGLQKIMPTAERVGVTVCMELLNSKVNHPDYMCDYTPWGVELVKRVGSERFKLLYDIYHMQIMEGDVIRTIQDNHEYFGHYHTGGNPGRNEIDETQELNYPAIMRAIVETGYTGFVAQEFIPTRAPLTSLGQAIALCDV